MERIERALKLVPIDFLQFYVSVFSDKFYDVCAINTIVFQEFEGEHVMNTKEIMELALKLAGLKDVREDSAIYVSGDNIRKIFFDIIRSSRLMFSEPYFSDFFQEGF